MINSRKKIKKQRQSHTAKVKFCLARFHQDFRTQIKPDRIKRRKRIVMNVINKKIKKEVFWLLKIVSKFPLV